MGYAVLGGRCWLAAVFAVAVLGKLHHRAAFDDLARSLPVPGRIAVRPALRRGVAGALLAVEAAIASAAVLMPGRLLAWPMAAAALLLLTFAAVILVARRHGRVVACRCFGAEEGPLGPVHAARDLVLAAAAATTAVAAAAGTSPPAALPAVTAVGAGLAAAALTVRLPDLVGLFTAPPIVQGDRP